MVNRLAKAYLYALVPVFSLSIEDTYWLKRLVGRDDHMLFRGGMFSPALMLLLAGVGLLLFRPIPRDKGYLRLNILMGLAILTGICVGIIEGGDAGAPLFEFRYWRALVFSSILAGLIVQTFRVNSEYERYLNWFVLNQVVLAAYALVMFLFLGSGQVAQGGRVVPMFAGDQLSFMIIAGFLLSAGNSLRFRAMPFVLNVVVLLVLVLSYRRTVLAAALACLSLFLVVPALSGVGKRALNRGLKSLLLGLFLVAVLSTLVLMSNLDVSFLEGRLMSINPFWARDQVEVSFTTMGHNDDFLDGLDLVTEAPLMGKGLNTLFIPPRTGDWQSSSVHSTMFSLWIKMGIFGLVYYLFVATFGMRFVFRRWRNVPPKMRWLLVFAVGFSFSNFASTVYSNGVFFGYKGGFCLAVYVSACILLARTQSASVRSARRRRVSGGKHMDALPSARDEVLL